MVFSQQKSQKKNQKNIGMKSWERKGSTTVAIVAVFKATLFVRLRLCCAAALSELYIS